MRLIRWLLNFDEWSVLLILSVNHLFVTLGLEELYEDISGKRLVVLFFQWCL